MSIRSAGFEADAAQFQQVARQYDGEGADLVQLGDTVLTNVGEAQVGRAFRAVAAPYRQAFEQFGGNLARFGDLAVEISGRLNDMATSYVGTEDANQRTTRTVY